MARPAEALEPFPEPDPNRGEASTGSSVSRPSGATPERDSRPQPPRTAIGRLLEGALGFRTGLAAGISGAKATAPRTWFIGALSIAAVGLVSACIIVFWGIRTDNAHADRRDEALSMARRTVTELTTVGKSSSQQEFQQLIDGTTGDFKAQLAQYAVLFRDVLAKNDVESEGTVSDAATARIGEETAELLVASRAAVKNAQSKNGEQRYYRFVVTLQRTSDRWLVSNLNLVP